MMLFKLSAKNIADVYKRQAFGQGVIIVLIQIGGMGVITIALLLTRMSGRKIGLRQRTCLLYTSRCV